MNTKILSIIFIITALALSSGVYGHAVSDDTRGYDIELNIDFAFQGDAIALEVEINKDSQHAEGFDVAFEFSSEEKGFIDRIPALEREPGHYIIKYAFDDFGPHDANIQFESPEGAVAKNFHIDVAAANEFDQHFIIALILTVLVAAWYGITHKQIKKAFMIVVVLLAIIGLGFSVMTVFSSGAATEGITVCNSPTECVWTAHIHAEVDIISCGEEFRFPVEVGPLDGPHTHEEKNTIHWHERAPIDPVTKELLDPTPLTLGAFFDATEINFESSGKILDSENGDNCNGQPGTWKMYVSKNWNRDQLGQPSASFRDYIWSDGDVITLISE